MNPIWEMSPRAGQHDMELCVAGQRSHQPQRSETWSNNNLTDEKRPQFDHSHGTLISADLVEKLRDVDILIRPAAKRGIKKLDEFDLLCGSVAQ